MLIVGAAAIGVYNNYLTCLSNYYHAMSGGAQVVRNISNREQNNTICSLMTCISTACQAREADGSASSYRCCRRGRLLPSPVDSFGRREPLSHLDRYDSDNELRLGASKLSSPRRSRLIFAAFFSVAAVVIVINVLHR